MLGILDSSDMEAQLPVEVQQKLQNLGSRTTEELATSRMEGHDKTDKQQVVRINNSHSRMFSFKIE